MNVRIVLWSIPALVWALFTFWYTDFGGPLDDREIDAGLALLREGGVEEQRLAKVERFLREDTGRQFLMVNNIDLSDAPPPMAGFGRDATAMDYVDHYMEHMYRELFARACHPVFYATALGFVADLSGIENAEGWDTAALFRYRSRRSFLEIITLPETHARHEYKLAAMTKTIAYPVEASLYLGDPRLLLALVLGLATALADIALFGRRVPRE